MLKKVLPIEGTFPDVFEKLTIAVVWLTPELGIASANAPARALLARLDENGRRNQRLARSIGASAPIFERDEAKRVREFLGTPDAAPRRVALTLAGCELEVGVTPLHGAHGNWLGWLIDACEPAQTKHSNGLSALEIPLLRMDSKAVVVEINAAAHRLLAGMKDELPFSIDAVLGTPVAQLFGVQDPSLGGVTTAKSLQLTLTTHKIGAHLAPLFTAEGKFDGALVTLTKLARNKHENLVAELEAEAQKLIEAALDTVGEVQKLVSEPISSHTADPAGVL